MRSTDIPAKFPIAFASGAGAGFVRAIPAASQIGIVNGAASLTDGFPPLNATPIEAGGVPPDIKDMNGILLEITEWSRWQAAGGPVYYDADFSGSIDGYPSGAVIMSAVTPGLLFRSTADNNGTNPDSGGSANWVSLLPVPATLADLIAGVDTVKYVTAATLAGLRASSAQILAGADTARYMTPAAFYGARAAGADVLAGVDDHKYLTAYALAQAFGGDGQTFALPGGLLGKIVTVAIPTGGSSAQVDFVFTNPFPTAVLWMGGNPDNNASGSWSGIATTVKNRTVNGGAVLVDTCNTSNPIYNAVHVIILAIGR